MIRTRRDSENMVLLWVNTVFIKKLNERYMAREREIEKEKDIDREKDRYIFLVPEKTFPELILGPQPVVAFSVSFDHFAVFIIAVEGVPPRSLTVPGDRQGNRKLHHLVRVDDMQREWLVVCIDSCRKPIAVVVDLS